MRLKRLSDHPIQTLDQLEQILLSTIPTDLQSGFFGPPHPVKLAESDTGINQRIITQAGERVRQAIEKQEQVVIFGDYDCDGVTATAILWETLHHLGLNARPFLPHRQRHGYGLSQAGLEEIWQKTQPTLVITVDNGIVANEPVQWLKQRGVDVIITDHHVEGPTLPPADLILHSTKLCGASISWLLANELDSEFAQQQLDLAAIGTIADQVPLLGANRSFATHGLKQLRQNKRTSLRALAQVAGLKLEKADAMTIHFGIAPRINAMGRLYESLDALRALVSRNPTRVTTLMQQLQVVNQERQQITKTSVDEVVRGIRTHDNENIVVVTGHFHEGIIGLIASKLVDLTGKPSIAISTTESVAKASCRSVPGFNLTQFLRSLDISFLSLGGHAMAAGFSLAGETVGSAVETIRAVGMQQIDINTLEPSLSVVGDISVNLLNRQTTDLIERFSPFGADNQEPLFVLPSVNICKTRPVGRDGRHAQLLLDYAGQQVSSICFSYQDKGWHSSLSQADAVVRLTPSDFPGKQLEINILRLIQRSG